MDGWVDGKSVVMHDEIFELDFILNVTLLTNSLELFLDIWRTVD